MTKLPLAQRSTSPKAQHFYDIRPEHRQRSPAPNVLSAALVTRAGSSGTVVSDVITSRRFATPAGHTSFLNLFSGEFMPKNSNEPRTLPAFKDWLEEIFGELSDLCRYGAPNGFDQMHVAETVERAHRLACRFGGGHVVSKESTLLTPRDGLAAVGQLLAWTKAQQRRSAILLSAKELGELFSVSTRSIWRMRSAGEIPEPIEMGGLTRWRRTEIEAMIDLAGPKKR
ncbi:MAG: helix-turn-helix transcriptional regulator [Pirellulales bacterium]